MTTIYLIDASIYIFRAYFSLPDSLRDAEGQSANAVYGFADFLVQLITQSGGSHFAIAFDESLTSCFRNEIYPPYKANRELPDPALATQLSACRELAEILGFATYSSTRFEADDLIGTLGHKLRQRGHRPVYVSGDKDIAQLVRAREHLWDFARGAKLGKGAIRARFGVAPESIADLLALAGDSADNIPGIPGIGIKSATTLLRAYHSLEGIYAKRHRINDLELRGAMRIQQQLERHHDEVFVYRALTRIKTNVPLQVRINTLKRKRPKAKKLQAFMDRMGFGRRLRVRLEALRQI